MRSSSATRRFCNSIRYAWTAAWFIEAIHRSKPSCGNGAVPDVVPIVHAVETDAFNDFVGAPLRHLDRVTQGRHAQHAPTVGDDGAIFQGRPRVKHPEVFSRRWESRYDVAFFRGAGITGGSENHPERGAAVPFRLDAVEPPVRGALDQLEQVAFQAQQNRLRFRIAEAAVEFQHTGVA